jgi:hypothetical protein
MPEEAVVHTPTPVDLVEFGTFRKPEHALAEMELVAKAFALRAERLNLFVQIGPSKHLKIEGWQILAMMYRVSAGIVKTGYIQVGEFEGYEATAEAIYVPTGTRISTAEAQCLNDEDRWDMRPEYEWVDGKKNQTGEVAVPLQQLRSMAQTRACSKVLSNLLRGVAVMSGFAGTPAAEMTGKEDTGRQHTAQPQRASNGSGTITDPQVNRLFGLAKQAGKSREALGVILAHFGYTAAAYGDVDAIEAAARLVKKGDFDKIQTEVMKPV